MKLFCVHCSYDTPVSIYNAPIFVECNDVEDAKSLALSHCKDVLRWSNPNIEFVSLIPHFIKNYEPNR